jgi:hypothetical protein
VNFTTENESDLQDGFSEIITNEAGLPCEEAQSEKVRKAHRKWKNEVDARRSTRGARVSYWRRKSSTASL